MVANEVADMYYSRNDVTLPIFDRNGIDTLGLVDEQKKIYKVITDKNLLDKLWDTLENNEKKNEDSGIEFANGHITLPQDLQWDIMEAGKSVAYHQTAG